MQSYCSNSGRREARLGEPSSASRTSARRPRSRAPAAAAGRSARRARSGSRSYSGQSSTSAVDRHVAHHLVAVEHPQAARVGDLADRGGADLPALADLLQLGEPVRLDHAQHPLLGLGDHDLEGLHVVLAQRHLRHVEVQAHLALGGHLRRRRVRPAAPRSCSERSASRSSSSRQHSSSFFSSNGSPICTDGRLDASSSSSSARGQHRRAADAVAARARAHAAPAGCPRPAAALRISRSSRAMPRHMALTRQFCSYGPSK